MTSKHLKGWLKHWDFILIDLACLLISFILAYWLTRGFGNPFRNPVFRDE